VSNILIVEDNPDIAQLYQRLFFQHQTAIYTDTASAIEALSHQCPDLIILDFHLPAGHGLDVLDFVRSQPEMAHIPVLGISADDLLKSKAKAKGLSAFFPKPLDIDQLLTATRQLLPQ
jgi:CheY-like chemotaxis protein